MLTEKEVSLFYGFTPLESHKGVRLLNFSSPHPFTFDDGTRVGAEESKRSKALELMPEHETAEYKEACLMGEAELSPLAHLGIKDFRPYYCLTDAIVEELKDIQQRWEFFLSLTRDEGDGFKEEEGNAEYLVILIPLPMKITMEREGKQSLPELSKDILFATTCLSDRQNKICSANQFGWVEESHLNRPSHGDYDYGIGSSRENY